VQFCSNINKFNNNNNYYTTTNYYNAEHLAEYSKSVVGQQSVGLVHEEVSSNELLEAPVFALHEPICPLTLYTRVTIS